jgi:hypothetical protein
MSLFYKDDIGAKVIVDLSNLSLPATATVTLIVKKPVTTTPVTWTPVMDFVTGIATYTTVAGDLNESGEYQVQAHGVFIAGEIMNSNIDSFNVYDKIT